MNKFPEFSEEWADNRYTEMLDGRVCPFPGVDRASFIEGCRETHKRAKYIYDHVIDLHDRSVADRLSMSMENQHLRDAVYLLINGEDTKAERRIDLANKEKDNRLFNKMGGPNGSGNSSSSQQG